MFVIAFPFLLILCKGPNLDGNSMGQSLDCEECQIHHAEHILHDQ